MKTLFLSIVLLGLVAALQAQDPLSFPSEELNITGTWYTKAVVVNMTQVPGWKRPRKVIPMRVTALEDGTWEAKTTLLINGRCLEKKITLQKTEEPGRYRAWQGPGCHRWPCPHSLCAQHPSAHLVPPPGRTPEENLEALEEFRKFTQRKGLLAKDIFTPELTGEGWCCPEVPSWASAQVSWEDAGPCAGASGKSLGGQDWGDIMSGLQMEHRSLAPASTWASGILQGGT
uniref:Lipocalin/cytosolic fatty-acid binding domain-containing protein n=1 Tax=Sciurus vulgaris TaxID=55149 RepID=A0A8D2DLE4_SCIVU